MQAALDFLEQPLDPFGTRMQNVDLLTREFLAGAKSDLISKLLEVGYFD